MLTRALTTVADFFRAGYPTGVPATGYLPLFALLRRRLSDDEVLIVAGRTNGAGPPILQSDIRTAIAALLRDTPLPDDVDRVSRHLAGTGWLVADASGAAVVAPDGPLHCTVREVTRMSAQNTLQGPQLVERLAELAPEVREFRPADQLFADIAALAVELIPGADVADIMVLRDGAVLSMGATSPLAALLDELQQRFGEGPCAQAAADSTMVRADDFGTETRWPRYSPAAVARGVRSSLSYKIYCAGSTAATMNIFGFGARPWDDDAETVGAVLASHAAAAVAASPWGSALTSPLGSRERLGQAKGIIMERYGVDDVAAFEMLRRLADQSDMGLLELAQRVIDTRTKGA